MSTIDEQLVVCGASKSDVYGDIIRVPEKLRKYVTGEDIISGEICRVEINKKHVYAILRGVSDDEKDGGVIKIDEPLRRKLGVTKGDLVKPKFFKSITAGRARGLIVK